jgi:putative lipoprotein (rSAM/lipoprotein system)
MKQITSQGRMLLRKILTGLSLGAVAVTFQACYGTPIAYVTGTVKAADTKEPISGIQISSDKSKYKGVTDENGWFGYSYDYSFSFGSSNNKNKATLLFKDIDGSENGEFLDKRISVTSSDEDITVLLARKE